MRVVVLEDLLDVDEILVLVFEGSGSFFFHLFLGEVQEILSHKDLCGDDIGNGMDSLVSLGSSSSIWSEGQGPDMFTKDGVTD